MNEPMFDLFINIFSWGFIDDLAEMATRSTSETIAILSVLVITWIIIIKLAKGVLSYVGINL